MEIATGTASGMSTEVGKRLLECARKEVRCFFCFNNIVGKFEEAEKNLQSVKSDLENKVKRAEDNTEEIRQMVKDWLDDAAKILLEVETMKEEIQGKKSCLNGWCLNLGSRYWLGRKAYKKTINMSRLKNDGNFDEVGTLARLPGISAPKDFECFRSTTGTFDEIVKALKNDGTHMVILHGMGGVGKTTLAQAVSKKVKEEGIFNEVVMATVSQTPNFRNIQGQLADLLNLKLEEETEEGRAKRLLTRFSDSNNKLIILDDIWEEFNFEDKIGVPLSKGCKMLLTTRHKNVFTDREYQSLIHLNVLKEHEGVSFLKRRAGIDDDDVNFNTLAIRIARECDGLPLALATIGSHLRGKKDTETWEFVCEKLKKSKLEDLYLVNSTERGVYASLKLSYDYLKGDKIRFFFLMCSLFPEDFEIPFEDLVRIGVGLDLYEGVSSIEEARRDLRLMVEALKALGLLLDADGKEFVRMHDVVRDVALWITSKGENIFMSKSGMDLTQLSRENGWKQYTAISLLDNKLNELSFRLVCPKLKILLLGDNCQKLKVSAECFLEMKAVEVVSLRNVDLSLKSLQFLTNLKTLVLYGCNLRDISYLAKLNKLEILSFRGSCFLELPIELSELKELRMLDLRECYQLGKIPSSLIRSFSQLEELYLGDIFTERKAKCYQSCFQKGRQNFRFGNAWLSDVNYLSRLAVLYLQLHSKCLPKDFAFSKLLRYEIRVNETSRSSKSSKALIIAHIDATLLTALFKALFHSVEYLSLESVIGCQNILPSIDQKGLKKLNTLNVGGCKDLKCVIDASQVGEENPELHPSLAKLDLGDLPELQSIWNGPMAIHIVNFQSLTDVYVRRCKSLAYLFTLSIARSLGQLKSLRVSDCESLEFLLKIEEGDNGRGEKMLSKLEDLEIKGCNRLEYVFPVCVAAGLIQLKNLEISGGIFARDAAELKQVFHGKEENEVAEEGNDIKLPNLKNLTLYNLVKLTRFFPENNHSSLPALEELKIFECPNLTIKEGDLEEFQNLHVVEMDKCNSQLYNGILSGMRCGFFKKIERLSIKNCGVTEVFQLEGQQHELSLSQLKSLKLNRLQGVQCLTTLTIHGCKKLKHIFPFTVAQRFGQLKSLEICDCTSLEVVISGDEKNINLPKLKKIKLERNANLKSFCPEKYHLTCPALEEFQINPSREDIVKRFPEERFKIVVNNCSVQLSDEILFRLRCGFFKNFEVLIINNCRVKEVFQLEGQEHELTLPNLKSLKLDRLQDLKGLCKGPAHVLRLGNLTTLTISGCYRLTHIFSFTLAQRLGQLESLTVSDCENLKQILYLDHEREEYVDGGDHKNIVLPNLKYLRLERLAKLVSFFPEKYDGCFPALEEFKIKDCCNLTTSFIGDEQEKLRILHVSNYSPLSEKILYQLRCGIYKTLKNLQIENYGIQVIFELGDLLKDGQQEELLLPNLKNFELHRLKNLTYLTITQCNKLKHIFPSIVARNYLLQLEVLHIRECGELEQIIDVKDGEEVGANLLQTLRVIIVVKCHKLKNLFPISIALGFQKLERLEVRHNSELEQVFGDNGVIGEKEIQFPRLGKMLLKDLPRLTNYCHVDYHFIFPSLFVLEVKRCPKISTRFSLDEDNGSVHAEAKAPKIGRADDSHEEQAPEIGSEDEGHEETSTYLNCWFNLKKIPPYVKNEELHSNSHPTE